MILLPNFIMVNGYWWILYPLSIQCIKNVLKYFSNLPSSDADQMRSKLSLNKDNKAEFLIRWDSSARDRNWEVRLVVTAGGCMVRSNGHPSSSNKVRCFPSLGFLPFRQDGRFNGCLLMWKYTVYTVCVCIQARMFGSMYVCVCLNVCAQMIHRDTGSHVLVLPLYGLTDLQ